LCKKHSILLISQEQRGFLLFLMRDQGREGQGISWGTPD